MLSLSLHSFRRLETTVLNKRLSQLEGDEAILQKMYPQGEDRDVSWTVTVMSYYASLVGGVVCAVVSLLWMLHIGAIPFILIPRFFFLESEWAIGLIYTCFVI